jgi:hypothetical protein
MRKVVWRTPGSLLMLITIAICLVLAVQASDDWLSMLLAQSPPPTPTRVSPWPTPRASGMPPTPPPPEPGPSGEPPILTPRPSGEPPTSQPLPPTSMPLPGSPRPPGPLLTPTLTPPVAAGPGARPAGGGTPAQTATIAPGPDESPATQESPIPTLTTILMPETGGTGTWTTGGNDVR